MSNGELGKLTQGERLLISRRRRGENQQAAADRHGATRFLYGQWERGALKGPSVREVDTLRSHERCLLYRRRCEMTQKAVAADLNLCRWWINQMERGVVDCTQLVCYWEQ